MRIENHEEYNQPFSMRELMSAIKHSGSTAVGPDQIHYDFFRHMHESQIGELLTLFNFIWMNDVFPDTWKHSYIIPILKPGKDCNKKDCN